MKPHRARKRFGQNFLRDQGVIDQSVRAIAPRPGQRLVEIGPGEGALTKPLLQAASALTVIEIDRDLAATLAERLGHPPGLRLIEADVLTIDFTHHFGADVNDPAEGGQLRVVGNLPYNISTPVLFHLFEHLTVIEDIHVMLQKEVVDRLAATPGGKDYGRLSVMAQFYCQVEALFEVPPEAFRPAPKVRSAVVRLTPQHRPAEHHALAPALAQVVRLAFGQRRKTVRNSLSACLPEAEIAAAEVDPGARAETLDLDAFMALARRVS